MKIITCASYVATGSSAISDFFSEFSNCYCPGDAEIRFIFDPDGIRDLEYKIVEMNDRHNSGHAIKKYMKLAKYLNGTFCIKGYRHYMGDDFMKYTREYVDNITELKTTAWWNQEIVERGNIFHFFNGGLRRLTSLFTRTYGINLLKLFRIKSYFSAIDKETFYKYTKEYISKILTCMNKNNSEYLMVDQLLPASNVSSYFPYFDDNIKVIISERDPRDLYLFEKVEFRSGIIPANTVQEFCEWYRIIRKHRKKEIYDPDKVYLEEKYPKYKDDVRYIEEHLKEYLYDFPV